MLEWQNFQAQMQIKLKEQAGFLNNKSWQNGSLTGCYLTGLAVGCMRAMAEVILIFN